MKQRFNFPSLPMLLAALTVADNFSSEKATFLAEKPLWVDPFIDNYKQEIRQVLTEYYGINTREELLKQTALVQNLSKQVLDDLQMIKVQIERGFRSTPLMCNEILAKLGYSTYGLKSAHNSHASLLGLEVAFSNNLTSELRVLLEQNGVNSNRLSSIMILGRQLIDAGIIRESLKSSSKLDTGAAVTALNDIYDKAIDICAIGQQLFKRDTLRKEMFVFGKLVKRQGVAGKRSGETTTEADKSALPT